MNVLLQNADYHYFTQQKQKWPADMCNHIVLTKLFHLFFTLNMKII